MEIPKSSDRGDRKLQTINKDAKPLTIMDKIRGKHDDIENLEEVIDVERDLEIYQKNTLRIQVINIFIKGCIS